METALKYIVVIPACNRPEFLALCLRRLSEASYCPEVHIYADTAANLDEIEIVRDLYFPTAFIFYAPPHIKAESGCWNILNAIKNGSKFADNVCLIEEDVMVYPNYFEWQFKQTSPASCGRKIPNFDLYTNPGSCLRRPLLDALIPHINDSYFSDPDAYCEKHFSPNHISTLDDGLIRRVLKDANLEVTFPEKPVCAHQGFRMYNRIDIYTNRGTLEERINGLEKMLKSITPNDRYAKDFEVYQNVGN